MHVNRNKRRTNTFIVLTRVSLKPLQKTTFTRSSRNLLPGTGATPSSIRVPLVGHPLPMFFFE